MLSFRPAPRTHPPSPAKRWRNYYRVYRVLDLWRLGTVFPGVHAGPDVFPSKEIAEQHALAFLAALNPPGRFLMDHAGAWPEGERGELAGLAVLRVLYRSMDIAHRVRHEGSEAWWRRPCAPWPHSD